MTLLAGVLRRVPGPDARFDDLVLQVGRTMAGLGLPLTSRTGSGYSLVVASTGALGTAAVSPSAAASFVGLVGDPLLTSRPAGSDRSADAERLREGFDRESLDVLREARGVFSGAWIGQSGKRLVLFTDKLGIRPLYYRLDDQTCVFASALDILERVPMGTLSMDLAGVTELASLGYSLADRTPYAEIKRLRPGSTLRVSPDSVRPEKYWRWEHLPTPAMPANEFAPEAYRRFVESIRIRLGPGPADAFLSGGLDSRCIVAALRQLGAEVDSYNFARPGMADQVLARGYAETVGARHHEAPRAIGLARPWSRMMVDAMGAGLHYPGAPYRAWSGDGGSVCAGYVYMTESIVAAMRSGRQMDAVREFLSSQGGGIIASLYPPALARQISGLLVDNILAELADIDAQDPARRFHLFLLYNDQSRHLSTHFEQIQQHQLELLLPFFDSRLLEIFLSVDVDRGLLHRFYGEWLTHFPPETVAVPWQAYPGHQPCPIPFPDGLDYQWAATRTAALDIQFERAAARQTAAEVLGARPFPDQVLNRRRLWLASWLHRLGVRNYGYLFSVAEQYLRFWNRCAGRVAGIGNP